MLEQKKNALSINLHQKNINVSITKECHSLGSGLVFSPLQTRHYNKYEKRLRLYTHVL